MSCPAGTASGAIMFDAFMNTLSESNHSPRVRPTLPVRTELQSRTQLLPKWLSFAPFLSFHFGMWHFGDEHRSMRADVGKFAHHIQAKHSVPQLVPLLFRLFFAALPFIVTCKRDTTHLSTVTK